MCRLGICAVQLSTPKPRVCGISADYWCTIGLAIDRLGNQAEIRNRNRGKTVITTSPIKIFLSYTTAQTASSKVRFLVSRFCLWVATSSNTCSDWPKGLWSSCPSFKAGSSPFLLATSSKWKRGNDQLLMAKMILRHRIKSRSLQLTAVQSLTLTSTCHGRMTLRYTSTSCLVLTIRPPP